MPLFVNCCLFKYIVDGFISIQPVMRYSRTQKSTCWIRQERKKKGFQEISSMLDFHCEITEKP